MQLPDEGASYLAEDPFEVKPPKKKIPKPRSKRCKNCRAHIEPDGYGGWVHSGSEEYPAAYYGCPVYDDDGYRILIKPADNRFAQVATL